MIRPTPEARALAALDELRDALGAIFARTAEPGPALDGLLTLTAAAERIGIARSTVSRWADTGRLRTIGPAHARRVPMAEIRRLTGDEKAATAPEMPVAAMEVRRGPGERSAA